MHLGRIYWRVMNKWCSLNPFYTVDVHKGFVELARKNLITHECRGYLNRKWPSVKLHGRGAVRAYLAKFPQDKHGYFKDDSEEPIFDLLKFRGKAVHSLCRIVGEYISAEAKTRIYSPRVTINDKIAKRFLGGRLVYSRQLTPVGGANLTEKDSRLRLITN